MKKTKKTNKKSGRPRIHDYKGEKKVFSIRLTDGEKQSILDEYDSVQAFIQEALDHIDIIKALNLEEE